MPTSHDEVQPAQYAHARMVYTEQFASTVPSVCTERKRAWTGSAWMCRVSRSSGAPRPMRPAVKRTVASTRSWPIAGAHERQLSGSASQGSNLSLSFDQRRSSRLPLTAIASARFWPTSTTNRLPRVIPV